MARKSSGGIGGAIGLAALGGIAWLVSEHGKTLLILVGVALVAWAAYALLKNRSSSRNSGAADSRQERLSDSLYQEREQPASVFGPSRGDDAWVPAGQAAEVQGRRIGGMVYVGRRLAGAGGGAEPALVDPSLRISTGLANLSVRLTDYWPSYSTISADARNAYLQWLATGRSDPTADVGYMFLYFYGLERRALFDAVSSDTAKAELPAIENEVARLLGIYGRSGSVRRYLGAFQDLLQARNAPARLFADPPPPLRGDELSFIHRLGLAQCANAGEPLPADWAYLWFYADPSTRLRTAAKRCPREFKALFKERYARKFGAGMTLPKNRTKLQLEYIPASRGFGFGSNFVLKLGLPDVTVLTSPVKQLQLIAEECFDALAGYSRAVGADGSKADSLEALAELPATLWPERYRANLLRMRELVKAAGKPAPIQLAKVLSWLPMNGELTRPKALSLYRALGQAGLGLEPDIRLGTTLPTTGSTVYVFATDEIVPSKSSPRYAAAALTLQLAVAVAAADGETTEKEKSLLASQLEDWLHLDKSERQRLSALLRHLAEQPPKVTGLKKSLEALDAKAREAVGDFVVLVAQSDAKVTASEVKMLEKIFKMLGLEAGSVYSKVHVAATEPVTVRAGAPSTEHAIPPKPQPKKPGVMLDPARVAALQKDSERVSAILGSIFNAPEEVLEPVAVEFEAAPQATGLMGLDADHTAFLRTLLSRPHWMRAELEELAADRSMMVDGTLERINEASFDTYDKPFLEGDDPVELNREVVHELIK